MISDAPALAASSIDESTLAIVASRCSRTGGDWTTAILVGMESLHWQSGPHSRSADSGPGRHGQGRATVRRTNDVGGRLGSRPAAMMTGRRSPASRREGEAPGSASRTVAAAILLRAVEAPGPG